MIASPVDAPVANTNVIQIRPGAHNGVLRNLEIVGELLAPRTLLMSGSFVPSWCPANCESPTYPPTYALLPLPCERLARQCDEGRYA